MLSIQPQSRDALGSFLTTPHPSSEWSGTFEEMLTCLPVTMMYKVYQRVLSSTSPGVGAHALCQSALANIEQSIFLNNK